MARKTNSDVEISEEKLTELKRNAEGILSEIRREIINRNPFYGTLAMSLNIIPVRDIRVPTACTDGENIFWGIEFLARLSNSERIFVFEHEILHNCMMHFMRNEGRDRELFNIATDLEVNQILYNDGLIVPKDCVMPTQFNFPKDKSAEEYYELLLNKNGNNKNSTDSSNGSNSESDTNINSAGNKDGKLSGQFDKHIYNRDSQDNDDKGLQSDRWGKIGFDKDYQPYMPKNITDKIRENIVNAVQTVERQRGEIPAFAKRLVEEVLRPKINWKEQLARFITKTVGIKNDWSRPNRRFISSNTYLPSHNGDEIKIGVIIDTSGSTTNMITDFLSEINGIVKNFNYVIEMVQCDAAVTETNTYTLNENPLNLENTKFNITGGGGTMMGPAFKYLKDKNAEIDAIVCLTDGYIERISEDYHFTPTMWVIGGKDSNIDEAKKYISWGEIVPLKLD